MAMKKSRKPAKNPKHGKTQRRRITKGPNKGDTVLVKGSGGDNFFPVRHLKDRGGKSSSRSARKGRRKK